MYQEGSNVAQLKPTPIPSVVVPTNRLDPMRCQVTWRPILIHLLSKVRQWYYLTLSPQNNVSSAKLLVCFNFQSVSTFQCRPKLVKMLFECQTAWILVRLRDTRRLIRIQAFLHVVL